MIIPVAALIVLLTPLALGGRLTRLAAVRVHRVGWIVAALAVQVVILELLTGPRLLLEATHIGTYLVALWFLLVNRRIPGLWLMGIGAASNGLAITLNGGVLPARLGALRSAGIDPGAGRFVNSGVLEHPRLALLGDVFAVPSWLPLSNVFSVGDVLIIAGVGIAAFRIFGTRWTEPWTPPRTDVQPSPRAGAPVP